MSSVATGGGQSRASRIPVPVTVRPLAPIDPEQNRAACIDMLVILYHAERAALEAFERLGDSRVVENSEIILRARPMLMAEEEEHARDCEEMIRTLGGDSIPPAPPGFDELWDIEQSRRKLLFPLPARVAALFTLIAESLGYAYLYHLARATRQANYQLSSRLDANVEAERRHIEISMDVLRSALRGTNRMADFELALHLPAFFLLSRRAAKTMMASMAEIGFDPYVIAASSLQFTCGLLQSVVEETSGRGPRTRALALAAGVMASPRWMRLLATAIRMPEPPLFWTAFRAMSRIVQRMGVERKAA